MFFSHSTAMLLTEVILFPYLDGTDKIDRINHFCITYWVMVEIPSLLGLFCIFALG